MLVTEELYHKKRTEKYNSYRRKYLQVTANLQPSENFFGDQNGHSL